MANCSEVSLLPLSEDFYSAVQSDKLYFIYVDVVLTVVIVLLFVEECHFVIKTYKHYNITVKSIWLISIYPVFAISALLAVLIPRAGYICDFVSTCYLSACIFQFSSLLLLYFGQRDNLLNKVKDTGFNMQTGPCCCCCACCLVLPPKRKSLVTVRLMIFQTAILQPMIQFTSAVLWADDKYDRVGIDFTQSFVYLTIFKVTSTLTAIYGLNVLHSATRPYLRTHNTAAKHTALKLVQVFFNIQGSILTIPARFNVPPCQDGFSSNFQMFQWHHLVLVVEVFLLSMLARLYYRRPLELDAVLEAQLGKTIVDIYTPVTDSPESSGLRNTLSQTESLRTHMNGQMQQNSAISTLNRPQDESSVISVQSPLEKAADDNAQEMNHDSGIPDRDTTEGVVNQAFSKSEDHNTSESKFSNSACNSSTDLTESHCGKLCENTITTQADGTADSKLYDNLTGKPHSENSHTRAAATTPDLISVRL